MRFKIEHRILTLTLHPSPLPKELKWLLQRNLQSYLMGERFSGLSSCSSSAFSPPSLLSSISSFWRKRNFGKNSVFSVEERDKKSFSLFPPVFWFGIGFVFGSLDEHHILFLIFSFLGFPQPRCGSVTVGPSGFL